ANGHHKLWRNNGDLTFTDVAVALGVNSTGTQPDGAGVTWGDYDIDGDLDLFVCGFFYNPSLFVYSPQVKLFRNGLTQTGVASFTDVTVASGIHASNFKAYSPIFADIDGDRYPELLVAGDYGTTRFFKNDTDGTFTEKPMPLVAG